MASNDLSTTKISCEKIPAPIIESPLACTKKVAAGCLIKCVFKSNCCSIKSSAGDGKRGNLTLPSYDRPKQPSVAFVCADEEAGVIKASDVLPEEAMQPTMIQSGHSKIESESEINLDKLQPDMFAQYNVYDKREIADEQNV